MNKIFKHLFAFIIAASTLMSFTYDYGYTLAAADDLSVSLGEEIFNYIMHIRTLFVDYFNVRKVDITPLPMSAFLFAAIFVLIALWIWLFCYHFEKIFLTCIPCLAAFIGLFIIGHIPSVYTIFPFFIGIIGLLSHPHYKQAFISLFVSVLIFVIIIQAFPIPNKSELNKTHHSINTYIAANTFLELGKYGLYLPSNSDAIGNGDLSEAGNRTYSGTTKAIVIVADKPTIKLFLKGYTADTYSNNTWSDGGAGLFNEYSEKNDLSEKAASRIAANYSYNRLSLGERSQMSIKIVDSIGKYQLVPYGAYISTKLDSVNDSYVLQNSNIETFYYIKGIYHAAKYRSVIPYEKYNIEYESVSKDERWYIDYVNETSLNTLGASSQLSRTFKDAFGSDSTKVSIMQIKNQLAEMANYNLSPGKTPDGKDFIDYFLFENHEGYCVHFATSAVMLLRLNGIPARYATGYAVQPNAFVEQNDGTYKAEVKDFNAHAWVEIFTEDLGWIPVEMTPAARNSDSESLAETYDNTKEVDSADDESDNKSEDTSAADKKSTSDTPQKDNSSKGSGSFNPSAYMPYIIIILIAFALLIILLWLIRFYLRLYIPDIRDGSYNERVCVMYELITRHLEYTNHDTGYLMQEENRRFYELAYKAAFSQSEITADEYKHAEEFFDAFCNDLYANQSSLKRFLLRRAKSIRRVIGHFRIRR